MSSASTEKSAAVVNVSLKEARILHKECWEEHNTWIAKLREVTYVGTPANLEELNPDKIQVVFDPLSAHLAAAYALSRMVKTLTERYEACTAKQEVEVPQELANFWNDQVARKSFTHSPT